MRALISVSNKEGVLEFAVSLRELGYEILSTGGTARHLRDGGVQVTDVSQVTQFPEILEGRVKTLHPAVHGGILAKRNDPRHLSQIRAKGIEPIDVVAVNLYPFEQTVSKPGVSIEEAIENIDIGGPSMVRAAAKNYQDVIVVVDPLDYAVVVQNLRSGPVPLDLKQYLAWKAFTHTAFYDGMISRYLESRFNVYAYTNTRLPGEITLSLRKVEDLRYGENPHQHAAFYGEPLYTGPLTKARQLHGKQMSFNNILDADAAYRCVAEFNQPAAVAVKHGNPCGCGIGATTAQAFEKAREGDPVSIFGGIVSFNRAVDEETAALLSKIFLEVVIAPGYDPGALALLEKKRDIRLLEIPIEEETGSGEGNPAISLSADDFRGVAGGLLIQEKDISPEAEKMGDGFKVATTAEPTPEQMKDLVFAWLVSKHVRSNAIVVAKNGGTLGIGAGQMSRIDAARLALTHAGDKAGGAVMASDGFFPFPDVVEAAAESGIAAIIQPGGSVKDDDSIASANKSGIAMVFTGIRHFKH